MRSWADLTSKEKELFDRQLRVRHKLTSDQQYEVEVLKINMLCGPLSDAEINRMEYLLNQHSHETLAKGA